MAVVTISRQLGSGARAIGIRAAELLGYDVVDKALITEVAREAHVDPEEVAEIDEVEEPGVRGFLTRWFTMESVANVPSASALVDLSYHGPGGIFVPPADADIGEEVHFLDRQQYHRLVQQTIHRLGERGRVIIVGRGGMVLLRDAPNTLRIRVVASEESRAERYASEEGITFREALHQVRISDRRRAAFVHRNYHVDWDDTALYHLVINSESSSTAMAASAIAAAVGAMKPVT